MWHLHIIGTKYSSVDGDNNEHEVEKKLASQISEPNKQNNVNKVEVEYYLKKKKNYFICQRARSPTSYFVQGFSCPKIIVTWNLDMWPGKFGVAVSLVTSPEKNSQTRKKYSDSDMKRLVLITTILSV